VEYEKYSEMFVWIVGFGKLSLTQTMVLGSSYPFLRGLYLHFSIKLTFQLIAVIKYIFIACQYFNQSPFAYSGLNKIL
jgi:hypothetical protein